MVKTSSEKNKKSIDKTSIRVYNKGTKDKGKEKKEMMKEETVRKINELKAEVGNKMFSKEEASKFISIQTLKKYDLIEAVKEVNREEVSIKELVAEVNSMLGQDCYGYNPGEYVYEDGKVYLETTSYGYKFK